MRKIFFLLLVLLTSYTHVFAKENILKMPPEEKPLSIKKKESVKKSHIKKETVGWVENVCIGDLALKLKGKIDTGAATSSVNADVIKIVKRGDQRFVFYRIVNGKQKSDVIEAELTRYTFIKPKLKDGPKIRRPVVMTEFKIGQNIIREEVNLAKRNHFLYPLLIGRNVLKNQFIVDAAHRFTMRTRCTQK